MDTYVCIRACMCVGNVCDCICVCVPALALHAGKDILRELCKILLIDCGTAMASPGLCLG